ncbi:glycosyltransferase family 8 protein, partial [Deltaproteobacteria bacterium OttesenSCG-928-K17]|nr:glycosyltransferase family 8 protein [Deltaproteobacteria bacterium OttesenSCG-928-K17]
MTPVIEPVFGPQAVAVAVSSDAGYAPYLATTLSSLIAQASPGRFYDLIVMGLNLGERDAGLIRSMAGGRDNISIRIFEISEFIDQHDFFVNAHVSKATYSRLLFPDFFSLYSKLLYLDVDLAVLKDVADLFDIDLENQALGVVRDYYAVKDLPLKSDAKWAAQLGLKNTENYFNAGVLLMNLERLRAENFEKQWFDELARVKKPRLHDQDILNAVCEGRVKFIDPCWNCQAWNESLGETITPADLPAELYAQYQAAKKSPGIIHYVSHNKPWNLPHLDLAEHFWQAARATPYYEKMLYANLKYLNNENDLIKARVLFPPTRLKLWLYKLLAALTT